MGSAPPPFSLSAWTFGVRHRNGAPGKVDGGCGGLITRGWEKSPAPPIRNRSDAPLPHPLALVRLHLVRVRLAALTMLSSRAHHPLVGSVRENAGWPFPISGLHAAAVGR